MSPREPAEKRQVFVLPGLQLQPGVSVAVFMAGLTPTTFRYALHEDEGTGNREPDRN
jgi:hypothetical protein